MRFTMRALVASILMVSCQTVVAAESGSSWWPFGRHEEASTAQPQAAPAAVATAPTITPTPPTVPPAATGPVEHEVQMPTTASDDSHWMLNTPKKKIGWPKLEMPKSLSSKSTTPKAEPKKNTWVDKTPVTPKTSPMQSVKKGAHSVSEGTKSAWHKTVAAVTPGEKKKKPEAAPVPHVAKRETSPSFWKKMMGAKEPELQQPQTVPQWMAQKRLDP